MKEVQVQFEDPSHIQTTRVMFILIYLLILWNSHTPSSFYFSLKQS